MTVDVITVPPGLAIRHQTLVATLLLNTVQLMWSNPQTFIIVKMFCVYQKIVNSVLYYCYVNTYTFPLLPCPLVLCRTERVRD